MVGKVLGRSKDFIKLNCAISKEARSGLMAAMYVARTDPSADVRRNVGGFLQEAVQSLPDTFNTIKPNIVEKLKEYAAGTATERKLAEKCVAELGSSGSWDAADNPSFEGEAAAIVSDDSPSLSAYDTELKEIDFAVIPSETKDIQEKAEQGVKSSLGASPEALGVTQENLDFARSVAVDVALSYRNAADRIQQYLNVALVGFLDEKHRVSLAEGVIQAVGAKMEHAEAEGGETTLCSVENLFLCYGGGKLLLRDTTLELLKDHRYGVVGRNGCGKTTLMNQMSGGGLAGMPPELNCVHVKHDIIQTIQELTPLEFCRREAPEISESELNHWLDDVGFPKDLLNQKVSEMSGGFCMRLILAAGLMQNPDVLLLDEPTNHLDGESVKWLAAYLNSMKKASLMIVSHEVEFLDAICTDIIQYKDLKMNYYKGNFSAFRQQAGISEADCTALLDSMGTDKKADDDEGEEVLVGYGTGAKSKISFPIPTKIAGVSASKPVLESKSIGFEYVEGTPVLGDVNIRITQASRVAVYGRNGCGKSTLLGLIAGELNPTAGEVTRHRNLRLAYIPQDQLFHLSDFVGLTPVAYIQLRFKNGYDELVQTRLLEAKNEEEASMRRDLAKKYGKNGCAVRTIVGRTMKGKDVLYEVAWEGLTDEKQNTTEPFSKLKLMGVEGEARAFDERASLQDIREVTRREIVKHFEMFGIDEDMVTNRQIGGFSAGQKSKLMLASAMWTRPHVICLDEPTNYVDVETLDAIARALKNFRGGIVVSSRDGQFLDKMCSETWLVEDGTVKVSKRETFIE
jgi:elongation factor 3